MLWGWRGGNRFLHQALMGCGRVGAKVFEWGHGYLDGWTVRLCMKLGWAAIAFLCHAGPIQFGRELKLWMANVFNDCKLME